MLNLELEKVWGMSTAGSTSVLTSPTCKQADEEADNSH